MLHLNPEKITVAFKLKLYSGSRINRLSANGDEYRYVPSDVKETIRAYYSSKNLSEPYYGDYQYYLKVNDYLFIGSYNGRSSPSVHYFYSYKGEIVEIATSDELEQFYVTDREAMLVKLYINGRKAYDIRGKDVRSAEFYYKFREIERGNEGFYIINGFPIYTIYLDKRYELVPYALEDFGIDLDDPRKSIYRVRGIKQEHLKKGEKRYAIDVEPLSGKNVKGLVKVFIKDPIKAYKEALERGSTIELTRELLKRRLLSYSPERKIYYAMLNYEYVENLDEAYDFEP